ncbi:dihydroorotate dehydrogenase (quinone) [Nocardioides psychrotolerans]|uniref:Dihydroorotate dehydrogenase (quinone) n=1 Tax=Nocardioides psychrotolerans TaxID=1005945 RepID=A0A1I3KNH8_9ACTN|nr:quinone-dependent dihydroorotate dehydrogenase [Nocardioides psychrotolerans]GEP38529.1 dihydroorotate dehydrogenase (quinone) [Nocardioides psychrotolerans]SFI74026.1 dihydroorotate oxidase A [Nocardioides psychrotolerans]
MTPYSLLFDHGFARIDPEVAHHLGFRGLRAAAPVLKGIDRVVGAGQPVEALGLTFPNVLGMAAGFDKNAVGIDALGALGFGHVEIGTVTGEGQPGNPTPRLFRLTDDRAVVNRMGFNNDGAEVVAQRLARRAAAQVRAGRDDSDHESPPRTILGTNIGKTKVVPDDDQAAVEADYEKSARLLAPHADYLVVNVSSPNTPGLRNLQSVEKLQPLLEHVRRTADEAADLAGRSTRVPLLVKIAPDLADEDVLAVADMALAIGLDGIVATNTTTSREGLRSPSREVDAIGAGGLSGRPLASRSLEVLRMLKQRVGADLTLVGVGGITTVQDAQDRLDAGADLLQGYTAFIYEGPLWPRRVLRGLG